MSRERLSKIALIGNYLPRKCGIATFTYDLGRALTHDGSGPECFVVAVNDRPEGYAYSPDVRFEIAEQDLPSYRLAADFLQSANVDVLCVQHEFGIYGGAAGSHLLALLRRLDLPIHGRKRERPKAADWVLLHGIQAAFCGRVPDELGKGG